MNDSYNIRMSGIKTWYYYNKHCMCCDYNFKKLKLISC